MNRRRLVLVLATLGVIAPMTFSATSESQGRCPDDMVHVSASVCIDRYPWPNIEGEKPQLGLSAIPEDEDVAKGRVMDAESLCASVGKRLCTASEWTRACRGPGGSKYPWGEELPFYIPGSNMGICNYDKWFRPYDEGKVFRRDPKHMAYLDQSEPAGSRPECVSPSGAHDMIGNVEQWVRCDGKHGYCLMGRYWADPKSCENKITAHAPKWHWYTTSGRCCLDIE